MRFKSIDVFRGLTVALMVIVNAVDGSHADRMLLHSDWHGCTLADLVFPFFILIVGVSVVFSLSALRQKGLSLQALLLKVFKRTTFIFLVGVLLNAYPYHLDFSPIRIMGVLQRIALCYCVACILYLTTSVRTQCFVAVVLLLSYWFLMTQVPVPGDNLSTLTPAYNWAAYIDRFFIPAHYLYTRDFDPEGLLSTLPAIVSALMGNLLGMFLLNKALSERKKCLWIVLSGLFCLLLGGLWSYEFPLNKTLWTSSYVLWTGGWGLLVFGLCYGLVDIQQWQGWARPFELLGLNAMMVFIVHVVYLKTQFIIQVSDAAGSRLSLRQWLLVSLSDWMPAHYASLLYGLILLALMVMLAQLKQYRIQRLCRSSC